MDGDLQHPPEVIGEMVDAWQEGFKIVETIRLENKETSWFKRMTSQRFQSFFCPSHWHANPYWGK